MEVTDRRVGILGTGDHGTREAVFLRGYTADVTLIAPDGAHDLTAPQRTRLAQCGIAVADGPATDFAIDGERIAAASSEGPS